MATDCFRRFQACAIHALSLLVLCSSALFGAAGVTLIVDGPIDAPARHGLMKLEEVLRKKGLAVTRSTTAGELPDEFVILAGLAGGSSAAAQALKAANAPLPQGSEALVERRTTYRGKPALILCAADSRGLMYAAIDAADRVSWAEDPNNPFAHIRDVNERPFIAQRSVSMYTMQRAYFESRLYDEEYWKRYFDLLSRSRINNFHVIFGYENGGFMAPLYSYFFDLDEYPDVRLIGISREQQDRNVAAFKRMIAIAHECGVNVSVGIWDHIYRGGVQGGGIAGASESVGKKVTGLVWGVTAENLASYTKAALSRFLEVFPEVDGVQFRMHGESGLKREEMEGFWHEVFALIKKQHPKLDLDLRVKDLPDSIIEDALNQGLNAKVSTKFWMEQMGLPFHPTHINRQNQDDRRHGYADLLRYPQKYTVHWQLWSGGTTRLLLWADPDYVRRFAQSAKLYRGNSLDVNEMLATKMLGEPHDRPPLPILNEKYRYYDYEFERYWHFYQVWGRLSFNPDTPAEVWEQEFQRRFAGAGIALMRGLHTASQVLPRIVAASYRYQLFPTTRGWAEMMRQDDLPKFADMEGSDIEQFMGARDAARSIVAGTPTSLRKPEETSLWFSATAESILNQVKQAEGAAGKQRSNEFISTIADLKILARLAQYHAARLRGAVSYNVYRETGDASAFDDAIAAERNAVSAWEEIVEAAGDVYSKELAFGVHRVGFPRHWAEELQNLQRGLTSLVSERKKAPARTTQAEPRIVTADQDPPAVRLERPTIAKPGEDLVVAARVEDSSGIVTVRLRYRHMTQFEDYEAAEMTRDPKSGAYSARIPGSFVVPKWDLMYFVEAIDTKGNGRRYPDLEKETPYVVVPAVH